MAERKGGAVVLVIVLYLVAAGGFGYGFYLRSESKKILGRWKNLSGQQRQYEMWKQEKLELQRKFERVISAINTFNKILPNEAGLNAFVKQIEKFAKESNLSIKRFTSVGQARTKKEQRGYKRFRFTMDCTGTWHGLCDFLKKIETWDRFVKVDAFELKVEEPPVPVTNILRIKVVISTFIYK